MLKILKINFGHVSANKPWKPGQLHFNDSDQFYQVFESIAQILISDPN